MKLISFNELYFFVKNFGRMVAKDSLLLEHPVNLR